MPRPLKHDHIYIRRDKNSYKCADPECSHWLPRKELKLKASICAVCFKEKIILDYENLQLARPRCQNCSNTKEAKLARERKDILKSVFGES